MNRTIESRYTSRILHSQNNLIYKLSTLIRRHLTIWNSATIQVTSNNRYSVLNPEVIASEIQETLWIVYTWYR